MVNQHALAWAFIWPEQRSKLQNTNALTLGDEIRTLGWPCARRLRKQLSERVSGNRAALFRDAWPRLKLPFTRTSSSCIALRNMPAQTSFTNRLIPRTATLGRLRS